MIFTISICLFTTDCIKSVSRLAYTVPKVIYFPRYNIKRSGGNVILRGIFHVVFRFPLHFVIYRGNLDYFLDSVLAYTWMQALLHQRTKNPDEIRSSWAP